MGVKVTGMDDIRKNLEKYKKRAESDVDKGLAKAAQATIGIIKPNTPVHGGRLRNSISYITRKAKGGLNDNPKERAENSESVYRNRPKKHQALVGTNVIYAERVEYFAKKESASRGFFERSIKQARPVVNKILTAAMKRGLR